MNKREYEIKYRIAERIIIKAKELTEAGYGQKRFTVKGDYNHEDYSIPEESHTKERK